MFNVMGIFSSLQLYAGNWEVKNSRSFSEEEKAQVLRAEVVDSQYGLSACFFMKGGGQSYIPMSSRSKLSSGDAIDMNSAFEKLCEEQKNIYTLEYFDEDAKIALSNFFKNNGAPLVPNIKNALIAVDSEELLEFVEALYPMYDPDSEVSIDIPLIQKTDEQFAEVYDSDKLCRKAAGYIKANKVKFF